MLKKLLLTTCLLVNTSMVFAQTNVIYLTRHAEKITTGNDPALTEQGQLRAENIAQTIERANISNIYSTDYNRTQQTAQPLSSLLSIPVQSYNPSDLTAFANQLKSLTGNTFVVGHSNTTPELVALLGGGSVEPIAEDEFDRLYQVIIAENGEVTTVLLSSLPRAVVASNCADVVVNLSSLSAADDTWQYESIEVPACAGSLTVNMSGGTGDADLHVRFGDTPTGEMHDCRPYEGGNIESCVFNTPQSGTWHIGIHAYEAFSGVNLTATAKQ